MYISGLYLLEELHDVSAIGSADNLEALEAGTFGQSLKLLLGPFFASGVVSQHEAVHVYNFFCHEARVWQHRKYRFRHYHVPVVRECIIAVLEKLQTVLVAPIMTYPLSHVGIVKKKKTFEDKKHNRFLCTWLPRNLIGIVY